MARIAIIGGGIGGLTTAIALRHFGFEPEVFEQAPALLDVGAAIAVWPNAMRVFRHLGISERVIEQSGVINEIHWLHHDGRLINRVRLKLDESIPAVALHRADLQHTLLSQLPQSSIHLGHNLCKLNNAGDVINGDFTNSNSLECDILVGADGVHSDVRATVVDSTALISRGYAVWRGIAPICPKEVPPHTAMEFHGEGRRFGLGPVGPGRLGWWASANSVRSDSRPAVEQEAHGQTRDQLLNYFSDWFAPIRELINATASITETEAADRMPSRSWGLGHTTLLGDAIHPTTPNLGQGGCMAIEDALVLARCCDQYGPGELALRTYERARRNRTAAITTYSRYYGAVGQVQNPLMRVVRNAGMRLMPESLILRLMRIVFDYNPCEVRL